MKSTSLKVTVTNAPVVGGDTSDTGTERMGRQMSAEPDKIAEVEGVLDTPYCCYIEPAQDAAGHPRPCRNDALWHIAFGGGPDDYTYACTPHAGVMISNTGAPFVTVTRIVD